MMDTSLHNAHRNKILAFCTIAAVEVVGYIVRVLVECWMPQYLAIIEAIYAFCWAAILLYALTAEWPALHKGIGSSLLFPIAPFVSTVLVKLFCFKVFDTNDFIPLTDYSGGTAFVLVLLTTVAVNSFWLAQAGEEYARAGYTSWSPVTVRRSILYAGALIGASRLLLINSPDTQSVSVPLSFIYLGTLPLVWVGIEFMSSLIAYAHRWLAARKTEAGIARTGMVLYGYGIFDSMIALFWLETLLYPIVLVVLIGCTIKTGSLQESCVMLSQFFKNRA